MNDCENIRELLPALVRGELSARDAIIARTHTDACAECRADLMLVRMMADNLAPVPAGLEAKVMSAVRTARPVAPRRWAPARLAMAATLAAAMIGGSIVYQRIGFPSAPGVISAAPSADASSMGWSAAEDPMLHGGSLIQELTVDELEMILAELDS